MGKRYSKTTKRTKKYTLSPKNALEIIRNEFIDSRENKHIFIMDIKPHNPLKPTIESTVEYKDNK